MPSLGADMDDGVLVEWLKRPGDELRRGDVIAVVETQKGAIDVETFDQGVLDRIVVEAGTRVAVGAVLALIRAPDEAPGAAVAPALTPESMPHAAPGASAPHAASALQPAYAAPTGAPAATGQAAQPAVRVTPAAMQDALARGLDLTRVAPGQDGIVGLREVAAAAASGSGTAGAGATAVPAARAPRRAGLDLDEMRKAIGAAMSRSKREIPHYYASSTVDAARLVEWLADTNAGRGPEQRLLYAAPLLKALATALRDSPEFNGHWRDGAFQPATRINIGMATALRGGGLVAPAILDVDTLTVDECMTRVRDAITRARAGRLRSSEMTEGTVTLSSVGEGGAEAIAPIIYPPQVAIIGCGAIVQRPWACGGSVVARPTVSVTVAGDHRVSDGRRASRLLARLAGILQEPERL